ncbi:MAG: sigma-70 family RNA polymerase sigma factor [Ardenticatenales bacterium]
MSTGWASARAPFESTAEPHLVARATRGERGAFGLLYQRHVERVFRFVVFRVRDEAMAEDLTQDIFISAYRGIDRLEQAEKFVPWLLTIARNRVLNHWRAAQRGTEHVAFERGDGATGGDEDWTDGWVSGTPTDDEMAALEDRIVVADLLAGAERLTDLQHDVLALRFIAGLSVADTAAVLCRSDDAVKNVQHHALKSLRRHVAASWTGTIEPIGPMEPKGTANR